MYTSFYKLHGRPFQLTPDRRFFFQGQPHKKAIAYLTYGLRQREGFIVITGDVGTGKTILADFLFSMLPAKSFVTGKVVTTLIEPDHLVRLVAGSFGLPHEGHDKATVLTNLEAYLVSAHRDNVRPLLLVDEAQNLSDSSLEELRMLSNFQRGNLPLLQTFLVGQGQFRKTLARQGLAQLRQRVIASCHLQPLSAEETRRYIEHRLHYVNWQNDPRFTDDSFRQIHEAAAGVPRMINLICDRVLLLDFLEGRHKVDSALVKEVVRDLRAEGVLEPLPTSRTPLPTPPDTGPAQKPPATAPELEGLAERVTALERRNKTR